MKYCYTIFVMLLLVVECPAQKDKMGKREVKFLFQNKVSQKVLQTDSTYQNAFGEIYKIRSFKYYISDVRLQYKSGQNYNLGVPPHLVNEADSNSKMLIATVPAGMITGLSFLVGIDSATNTNGVQTGDLDPAKGMFWIWNTGYIMAKLEGTSPSSKAPGKAFSYDIGGYKRGENAARQIKLPISAYQLTNKSVFVISADINKWFDGANVIKIGDQPMCHSPGTLAMQVANNYAHMFSIGVQ